MLFEFLLHLVIWGVIVATFIVNFILDWSLTAKEMPWKQELFGCFDNMSMSIIACCALPLSIGKNAEAVGEEHPMLWAFAVMYAPCIAGALLRGQIRKNKDIEGTFFEDCVFWWCLPCCAICQETAETGSMDYLSQPELQEMLHRDGGERPPPTQPE